ncbi:hypothetical protein OGATHE_004552 [Ogataea polymorpha]|uniref:Uncharacterized protein n=1 Tax=Ogataea polymorpha TaxID=460523 RepID=A0A9P8T2P3_9ASCO|nr:hypothetical protein OGATHE_004552 [Ogataea polymorpha]
MSPSLSPSVLIKGASMSAMMASSICSVVKFLAYLSQTFASTPQVTKKSNQNSYNFSLKGIAELLGFSGAAVTAGAGSDR